MTEIFDNIHKIYQYSKPCEGLSDYVDFFSQSSGDSTFQNFGNERFTVKMFPSWTPTFWINLGSPYQLTLGEKCYDIPSGRDVLILRDTIAERHNLPSDNIFTVKFFPGGLEAVFGINQGTIAGKVIDLQTILPFKLLLAVRASLHFEERVSLLQNYFLQHAERQKVDNHYFSVVHKTIAIYENERLKAATATMAKEIGATDKTIYRYFNKVIGTSPKNYLGTLRARTALSDYVRNRKAFDPDMFGYYDMSHFYKETRKFTGKKLIEQL
jgi:hypothetical protein